MEIKNLSSNKGNIIKEVFISNQEYLKMREASFMKVGIKKYSIMRLGKK